MNTMSLLSKSSKKKKGGLLSMIGVNSKPAPTHKDLKLEERNEMLKKAWEWLRSRIDGGINDYYRCGNFQKLEEIVERPALDSLKQELMRLRTANILWQ